MPSWNAFPYDTTDYLYPGDSLKDAWDDLHAGDCETWPYPQHIESLLENQPRAAPAGFDGDLNALALMLQDAWRSFHAGDFAGAVSLADQCGLLGHAVANKATGVQASYLEPDESTQQALFKQAIARAEQAIEMLPDDANSHYFHSFNLGRFSQSISIVTALKQGIGGKIQASLATALELQPNHAEAHTAVGLYHAEIIDKIGKMIGAMTYGANADTALQHFQQAIELTPTSPIAHIEYGNGLYLLFGDRRIDEVTDLYVKASEMAPRDAMERLDVEAALAELE